MPIEIRELIIEGSLARKEDRGEESAKVFTTEDLEDIQTQILDTMRSQGALTKEQRRELIDDILREVRKMMDDGWRR